MSDIPTLIKIIKYLNSCKNPIVIKDIISATQEGQVLIDRALDKLILDGVVKNANETYCYIDTPENEETCQKLFDLYDNLINKPKLELLVRGLLCRTEGHCLMRLSTYLTVLTKEGFDVDEMIYCLEDEIERGYITRVPISYIGGVPVSPPLTIPAAYSLRDITAYECQKVKEWFGNLDYSYGEADCLLGDYPDEIVKAAVEHMETMHKELLRVLDTKTFRQWHGRSSSESSLESN